MANMFRTIERQGGSGGPEWLSDHPNPGNRYEAIMRAAQNLEVEGRAPQGQIQAVHARLAEMPPAASSAQVARQQQERPVGPSGRAANVAPPSRQWQTVQPGDFIRLNVPSNWRAQSGGGGTVTYAPEGGYYQTQSGQSLFTHGLELGVVRAEGGSLQGNTEQLVQMFARNNPELRRQGGYSRTTVDGRPGLTTTLSNVSEVTGERETIDMTTIELSDGGLLFLLGVAPADEARPYLEAFGRVRQSIDLADR
jgi:hypothetical protein